MQSSVVAKASGARSYGRWYVLVLISLMYLITYLDRVNFSTRGTCHHCQGIWLRQSHDGGSSSARSFWSYAAFQVPGGWLGDCFGARNVLTINRQLLVDHDCGNGSSDGRGLVCRFAVLVWRRRRGAFPGATRAMQLWYPRHERGFVQGRDP